MAVRLARLVALSGALLALIFISGCGGGGEQPGPPPEQTSSIQGSVDTEGAGGDYEVLLDGRAVRDAMRADGTFIIRGVPPGEHRVAVVERGGMAGRYSSVVVHRGEQTRMPPLRPQMGGQIAGMITVRDDHGVRPLAGVEVIAESGVTILAAQKDGAENAVWPPPELPGFSAFTDEDGSYLIRAVPPGQYVVTVAVPDYVDNSQWVVVRPGRTSVADFWLRPAVEPGVGTVRGHVLGASSEGRVPIEGAMVSVSSERPWVPLGLMALATRPAEEGSEGGCEDCPPPPGFPDDIPPPWFYNVNTLTDAEGSYSLNAPAGRGHIDVFAPEYAPVWQEIFIEAGQVLVRNFTLEPMPDFPPPPGPGPVPLPQPPTPPELGNG